MMNPVSILMLLLTILGAENIFAQTAPPPDLAQEQVKIVPRAKWFEPPADSSHRG
jgi:hypothetical protein